MEKRFYTYSALRQGLRAALRQVEKGEQIIITVWGKPVAKLVQYGRKEK